MGARTGISWCDATWNPIVGCSRISRGCERCYAERFAGRFPDRYRGLVRRVKSATGKSEARWTGEVRLVEKALDLPLRWRKPRRIFVNSMSDLFHQDVKLDWIDRILEVIAATPRHTYLALTKRPGEMERKLYGVTEDYGCRQLGGGDYLPNLWLGVSVENQATADARIPLLLATLAVRRFLSIEPLLGPVDVRDALHTVRLPDGASTAIDLVILGCESGPHRRNQADYAAHALAIIDQCRAAGVLCFHKQMPINGRVSHDPAEWPPEFRVQEWPS